MEIKYFTFTEEAYKTSKLLHLNGRFHSSVYFGGYVLEGYLKTLLSMFYRGTPEKRIPELFKHSTTRQLSELISISSRNSSLLPIDQYILIQQEVSKLLNGSTNNVKWHPSERYKVNVWDDNNYSNEIQIEIDLVLKKIFELKTKGIIRN